jgi:hypothetical protein
MNNMAQQVPMINVGGSNLPPEIMQQQQALNRQQQMAQLLMQQGQSMPSGQMVSGRYVAPSFFQYAAPLFQTYAGQSLAKEGDKTALDLAKQLRQQYANEAQQYQNILRGKEQTFEQAGPTQTGGNIPNQTYRTGADPQAAYLFGSTAYNPVLQQASAKKMLEGPKWEKASFTDEKTGRVREGVIDVNATNPISTFQVGGVKPEMTAYERANIQFKAAELGDKGIGVNLGGGQGMMPQFNMLQGGGQTGQVNLPKADVKFVPSQIEQYVPDPTLTNEQNRAANAEFNKKLRANIDNAKDSFGLLKSAAETLSSGKPSSGRLENIVTGTREFFGGGGEASKTDATLTILGTKLTSKVPRFEGPQSDKDTALYQAAAGDLGNANKPIATRLAAVQEMINLNRKYYPNGEWESIDVTGSVTRKNILGGTRGLGAETMSPSEFRKTLSGADLEAFNFVLKNPNDKRTPAIKSRLGIE